MYRHILVPTDGSPLSLRAAKAAAKLAARLDARITALYVIEIYAPKGLAMDVTAYSTVHSVREYETHMRKVADRALARVRAPAEAAGVKFAAISVIQDRPWEAIVNAARQKKCDLIVMASHGRRGLESLLLGSQTQKVLAHSKTPVLVVR
jgi:nucleotide-binding universal stress UspA family protein